MKKKSIFILFALLLANSMLFSQEVKNGRSNSAVADNVVVEIQKPIAEEKFVSDQDEPNSKQLIAEDLYVDGSIGLGSDIVDGETFGYNTMIFRENNLRILFDDSSASGSFPFNDWLIEINESANGGTNHFAIKDETALTTPFKIMAGATTNALLIDDNTNIGFGTATPVLELHITDGNTPGIRLDQDGSEGWTAQSWDIAGNEANFFVKDVTNSALVFRIQPGAPASSLTVRECGNVGIGTWSPEETLHVIGCAKVDSALLIAPRLTIPDLAEEGDIYMDGNDHFLKLYNGTECVSWSDNQELDLTANTLSITDGNSIELDAYLDNTDEQDLVDATLTGTILQIDIENGSSVSVDLYPLIEDLEARVTALENAATHVKLDSCMALLKCLATL